MGTRLYPLTTDRAAIETLAKVPAGTFDRLDAVCERHAIIEALHPRDQEIGFQNWKEINDDVAMGDLQDFLTFGWGKFRPVMGIGTDYAGSEPDANKARWLLRHNGIDADPVLAGGVCWS